MKSLAVFCGSRVGTDPEFINLARELGRKMVENEITLVYGGAQVGIMGEISNEVMKGGGKVIGVIPHSLKRKEIVQEQCTELIVVDTMHDRKNIMYGKADTFVALPGGPGTMDEFFEIYTWSQLNFHQKPCYLWNMKGYYDHLIAHINHMAKMEFMNQEDLEKIKVISKLEELIP